MKINYNVNLLASIKKNNDIIITTCYGIKVFERYNRNGLFIIKFQKAFYGNKAFLSSDETHVLILDSENNAVFINLEERRVIGIFSKWDGLSRLYSNSIKNTRFIRLDAI